MTKTDVAMRRPPRERAVEPVMFTDDVARTERNPQHRGYCSLCGCAIWPGRFDWYCRVCIQIVTYVDKHD